MEKRIPEWETFLLKAEETPLSMHPGWLKVLRRGLGHEPYCLEATEGDSIRGILPLAFVHSWLFGRFLVSLPYLNYGGPIADDAEVSTLLVDEAVALADKLNVRYLELRDTKALDHPALPNQLTTKVHMRLPLADSSDAMWKKLDAKVRNQVRKGQKSDLQVAWGGWDLLPEFYAVFARNMRDLGTPVYGKKLFASIFETFPERAEFCVVRQGKQPVAAALLLHGWNVTEVPSASSLRQFNNTNANMLMYWHLLQRSIERKQRVFDFGRSSADGPTYRFKKQWGALPSPAVWQYYLRKGDINAMRPDNGKFGTMIRLWKRLPVFLTRWIGPRLVRGIP
ncbi:MAG: FemAB family PEP-CTERM system-associated protein [Gemmataceae bacterium]|nr:FemAB family PEP-CTERM system-associated protein [Gemmataceae bacterium]MCI0743366.1 FemAB family PEP-CTERM system-associated protein [Gemmataceae bacterium]